MLVWSRCPPWGWGWCPQPPSTSRRSLYIKSSYNTVSAKSPATPHSIKETELCGANYLKDKHIIFCTKSQISQISNGLQNQAKYMRGGTVHAPGIRFSHIPCHSWICFLLEYKISHMKYPFFKPCDKFLFSTLTSWLFFKCSFQIPNPNQCCGSRHRIRLESDLRSQKFRTFCNRILT